MTAPPFATAASLNSPTLSHGFFGRAGGVSCGIYQSLNTGPGSGDAPELVWENRARCAQRLGIKPGGLLTLYQIHSRQVYHVTEPWSGEAPRADAMVTATPGLALGILTADCMPFLFADSEAGVIGAAHAGWRGALDGVLEATIEAMIKIGAKPQHIRAGLGPCLRQPQFEVGLDLLEAFIANYPEAMRFFTPASRDDKRMFDLAGFGQWRLAQVGVAQIDDLGLCTLAAPDDYFSYRASRREGAENYGRNLSAIALVEG